MIFTRCSRVKLKLNLKNRWYSKDIGLKVLFFGTDNFSIASLKSLVNIRNRNDNKIIQLGVVHGGNEIIKSNKHDVPPVLTYARKENLLCLKWEDYKRSSLQNEYNFAVVSSFGYFIPQRIIKQFCKGAVNIHPSLLPRWRGPAPIIHTILAGDKLTGISVIEISPKKFDEGNILMQTKINVPSNSTNEELTELLCGVSESVIYDIFDNFEHLRDNVVIQDPQLITHAPKVTKDSGLLMFDEHSCACVERLQRALPDKIGIRAFLKDTRVRFGPIIKQCVSEIEGDIGLCTYHKKDKLLSIQLKDGCIYVDRIQVGNKPEISALGFHNGYMVEKRSGKPVTIIFRDKPLLI